jgi:hypothetical protein
MPMRHCRRDFAIAQSPYVDCDMTTQREAQKQKGRMPYDIRPSGRKT